MTRASSAGMLAAYDELGLTLEQLWFDYVSLGGNLPAGTVQAFLRDGYELDDHDFDVIVQAINEYFMDRRRNHPLPYAEDLG